MSYIFDRIPFFHCKVRREFTVNLKAYKGKYLDAIAVGVRMQRGLSIYFQVWLQDGVGAGAMFLLPIQALVTKPCKFPESKLVQPWDVFSSDFSCSRIDLFYRSRAYILPNRLPGRYLMTFEFTGNELSENLEQHKAAHLIAMDEGWLCAVPNNRLLIEDLAFLDKGATKKNPGFVSLAPEFYSE